MSSTEAAYLDRLQRVKAYIYAHLDEEIDLNRLAEVACLSPYHWHRVYAAVEGETIHATVKRLRLHRAAGQLAQTAQPLEEIARRAGYSSGAAFSRAFSAVYGQPPADYRRNGSHSRFRSAGADGSHAVEIREIPPGRLVALPHRGSYMDIGLAFDGVVRTLGARGLLREPLEMAALYYDDPASVPEAELRSSAGLLSDVPAEPPLEAVAIPGGSYAVLCHKGSYADMRFAYDWLFGHWLLASGREPADGPCLERYLNGPQDTKPADLLTEICIPLKPA